MYNEQPRDIQLQFAIKQFFSAYPNTPVSQETLLTYKEDLEELQDLEVLKQALRHLRRSKPDFIPSVAEIYDAYGRIKFSSTTEKESQKRKLLEAKTIPVPENETQTMLYAINHNIRERKAKEIPLQAAKRLAEAKNDNEGVCLLIEEIAAIRDEHQLIADMIVADFESGRPISYLKEIQPDLVQPAARKRGQGWSSVGDINLTAQTLGGF